MFRPDGEGGGMGEELRASRREVAEFHNLLFGLDDELDFEAEFNEDEDDEGPLESLLRHAQEIETRTDAWLEAGPLSGGSALVDHPVRATVQVNA
jgi:hypothetical protein